MNETILTHTNDNENNKFVDDLTQQVTIKSEIIKHELTNTDWQFEITKNKNNELCPYLHITQPCSIKSMGIFYLFRIHCGCHNRCHMYCQGYVRNLPYISSCNFKMPMKMFEDWKAINIECFIIIRSINGETQVY